MSMHRRTVLAAASAAAAVPLAAAGASSTSATASSFGVAGLSADDLGWDAASERYTLPDLPYAPDALEPVIDVDTMKIHHGAHHAGYVRGLNAALDALQTIRAGGDAGGTVEHWSRKLSFHAGGHVNHTLFWSGMTRPGPGRGPAGGLAVAIERDFGSFDGFRGHFAAAAKSVEGSGWGWLVRDSVSGRLMVTQMHNQQMGLFGGAVPLLGVDVWEHAYYLRYQNRRAAYVDAFFDVIDWAEIERRFTAAGG